MRTIDFSTLAINPSRLAWWRSGWTGRFVLAALLIAAAAAFALLPDRASAQTLGPADYCKSDADTNGIIPAASLNNALIADCIALLTVAQSLQDANNNVNWILTGTEELGTMSGWTGVTLTGIDHDGDANTPAEQRVTEVNLASDLSGGTFARQWDDLAELTTLNLSGNNLSGTVPRSVWVFFDAELAATNLNLSNNSNLKPSPPLGLTAAVAKATGDNAGKTNVTLTWNHTGWYTQSEVTDGDTGDNNATADTTHSYEYCEKATCAAGDWTAATVTYTDASGNAVTEDADINIKGAKAVLAVENIAAANTHVIQVRAKKSTQVDGNNNNTFGDATGDSINDQPGEASRLDLVGPQTVTAGSMFSLAVGSTYTSPMPGDSDDTGFDKLAVSIDGDNVVFTPKAASESVTVSLTQPHGTHTFPVEVLSADAGTPTATDIPNQKIDGKKTLNLADYFTATADSSLTYETVTVKNRSESNTNTYVCAHFVQKDNSAKVGKDCVITGGDTSGDHLLLTPVKTGGPVDITVTARDTKTRGTVSKKFWVRATVAPPNSAPLLVTQIPDQTLFLDDPGTQVDMSMYFRDLDYEALRYIPQSANIRVVTASSTGNNITFKVTGLGVTRMTIIAQDAAGEMAFGSFTVTVLDPNDAPEAVGTIPPQEIRLETEGVEIDASTYFTDPNDDPLTYTAMSADDSIVSASVDGSMVTLSAVALGESSVTVTATDDAGAGRSASGKVGEPKSATQEIFVVVLQANIPPELVSEVPDYSMQDDDEPLGVPVAEYFTDPDEEELSFSATGSDDTLARVDVHELTGDQVVVRLLRRVDAGATETLEVTVTARDEAGDSVSDTFEVVVQGNLPPEAVGSISDLPLLEGKDILLEVAEYFNDPNGDELMYTAASANPSAVNAVSIEGSQQIVIRGLAPAEAVGVTVAAMDPDGASASQLVTVTVIEVVPPPTATPEPTATPMPTATPEPTATPAPTATPEPPEEGGISAGLIIVLLLVLAGIAAAVFIIQRRR